MSVSVDRSPADLPPGLEAYKRTAVFTEETVPAALLHDHSTKEGTWGSIHVLAGQSLYGVTDPRRAASKVILASDQPPGIVEPTIVHHVELLGPVRFYVEFHRSVPDRVPLCRYEELARREDEQRRTFAPSAHLDGVHSAGTAPAAPACSGGAGLVST